MSDCSNSVDKYIIVESADSGSFSGLTICGGGGLTVDFITGCTSEGVNLEGAIFYNNTLTIPTIYTTTLSGGTLYGDGSNLTGISTIDSYMTGGTYSNGNITFTGNNNFSNVIVDVSALIDDTNYYVTGGTVSGTNLILSRNGGLSDVTIDTSTYFDNTDNYVSGGTYSNGNLFFSGTSTNQSFIVDVSALLDDTNTFVTGGTLVNGNTLSLNYNNGGSASDIDLSGIKFTGNTSGECITDLHVSNIHSCSPLNINPLNEGNVYFGQTSGVTIEIVDGRVIANYFRILTPPTSNQSLTQILGRNVSTGNVEFLSASTFVYKSDFDTYSGSVQSQINLKLNTSDFSIYTGVTQTQLDSKLNKTEFDSYSSTTQTTIDSKISFSESETRYVNVTGDTMTGTLTLPAGTVNDPSLVLSGGGTLLNTEQIGAFEFLGSSLYFTDQTGSRRNVLLAQSGFTATTVNALQDTEVSTVTNGQIWYFDGDTNLWRNTGVLTINDTDNKVDINSTLNVGGIFGITGSTTELNTTLNVYNGHVNLRDNSYFLQGTNTSDGNVSLIGVDNQDRVYIGNQGYDNYIVDDTTVNGDLHVSGDLTVAGSATTVNIISEDVLIADNFITLNSNVTGGTPTENAGIDISRGDETSSRILWNESTDLWEMGISGGTKRVILEGDSLALLTSGHTHPISEINGLQTELDSKLNKVEFDSYSGNVQTQIDSKLSISNFNVYSGSVQTELDSKLNKVEFDSYSGNVETELNSINNSLTGHTTDTNNPHQTSLGNLFGGSGHTHTLSEITDFSSYSGNVQTQLDTKIETASNLSGGTGLFSSKNGTDLEFKSISSSGGTVLISQDDNTVNLEVVHITDTKVTGFTYNDSNTLTISQDNGQPSYSTTINNVTGLTVNGTLKTDIIDFNTFYTGNTVVEGRMYWHEDEGTVSLGMHGSNVLQQIGLEQYYYIKNQSGTTIENGRVVKAAGTLGTSSRILGEYMIADGTVLPRYTLGIATEDIPNGEDGYVTNFGVVRGINTTGSLYGETWVDGDVLYASSTILGGLTKFEPLAPNLHIEMALVLDSGTNGSLFVRPKIHSNYHDLQQSAWSAGTENNLDVIQWDGTDGVFKLTNTPTFNSISATTLYGDGSNLTGIVHTTDTFVSGGTYSTGNLFFSGNSSDTSFIVDVSALLDDTNSYVTGGTVNGTDLLLSRNGGLGDVTIDTSAYFDNTDNFVTGGTLNGQTLVLNRTNSLSAVTIDLSTFLTETEADGKYLLNTTDTLNGDLTVTGNTSIGGTLDVSGSTTIYATDGELLLSIDETGGTDIEIGRTLKPDVNRSLSLGDGTHVWSSIWTEDIRLADNSGNDAITITAPSNIFPSSPDPVYGIVVPQTTGGTGQFLGNYNYDGGSRSHEMSWFSLVAGTNITLDTLYAASGSSITINSTALGSGSITGGTNLGGASNVFHDVNGPNLEFNTITGTSNEKITTSTVGNQVQIDIDEPKMTLWPLVVTGNKLISGGAAYLSGLDFSISPLVYIIGETIYEYTGGTVTLTSGDTTYDRIDVIYADDNQTVGVIEGTPSPNPSKPEVGTDQVEVTFVTVAAGETSPEVAITKIYDEALGTGGGEWDITASNNTRILTGSTNDAFSGTKSIELVQTQLSDNFIFNIPSGYNTSGDNILSLYVKVPSAGSWDDKRDLRITLLSGTTVVGGGSTPVSFGDSGNYGFDRTSTGSWSVISIGLGDFVLTQPVITDIKFEAVQNGTGGGANTIDAYIDLIRFQQGAATVSPQNLWLSFKTDDNIVTIADTNNEQLTVIGGSNIDTSGNNTSKSLTIDVVDSPYFSNLSASTLTVTGNTKLNGTLVVEGQSTFKGSPITFGNSFGDSVDFTARVNGNFVPVNNPGGNIGDPDRYWSNFYITDVSASTINISNVGTGTSVNNLGIDASGNIVNGTDVGEVNTASNVGVGTGIFSGKSNTDLQFYSLSGGTNTTLTLNDNTLVIDTTGGGSSLTVKEIDGTPSVNNVDTIRFSNGTVTDDGGGQVTVVVSGGTGSGLNEEAKIFSWFMNIT